jgi:serine/threonine protein kinase/tetratricopeptide (TPR) repeat protein
MNPERWRLIDGLLQAVLERTPGERDAFLREACTGDPALEHETRSLLVAHHRAGGFLNTPALELAAREVARDELEETSDAAGDLIGRMVARYRVEQRLGSGGMGVVYKAHDVQLERYVALKFLTSNAASELNAFKRFQREARSASALNHPNICTIYDLGQQENRHFIVMEYLAGETLRQRLSRGPLAMDALLTLAIEIADGLGAAHTAGIVHRDIKPANIFLTPPHHGKILDFGLAQLTAAAGRDEPLTDVGAAVGTADYMAPEQAVGHPVDTRADLFSFGMVLAEMATGTRPTPGSTVVVAEAPDLEHLISQCLERDPDRRIQTASDIRAELQRIVEGRESRAASPRTRLWTPRVIAAAALSLAVLIVASFVVMRPAPTNTLTDRDTIVIADLKNSTGESAFDGVLRDGLSAQLGQSPFLKVVSDERVRQLLRLMGQSDQAVLTPNLARDVCQRIGSTVVVEPTITGLGQQYILGLRASNCANGDTVDEEQAQAATREAVLDVLSRMASRFRTRVGESRDSVERHSTGLAATTTPSIEALRAYTNARKTAGDAAAVPLFLRALNIDPQFAMAHASLGIAYSNLGESVRSRESTIKAYQLRDRASDPERFFITAMYDRQVTGNLERERETLRLWAETYPRDAEPHSLLSGSNYQMTGAFDLSIEEAEKAIALDPGPEYPYMNLGFSYLYLGRLADAARSAQRASDRGIDIPESLLLRYFIAFLNGDRRGMNQQIEQAKDRHGAEDWIAHAESLVLARAGRLGDANRMSRLAIELAQQAGQRERAAMFQAAIAVRAGLVGQGAAARRAATDALELSTGRDVEFCAAFALALAGDSPRSRALTDDLERRFPEDTSVRFSYLPTLRALSALKAGDSAAAIRRLQDTVHFDLDVPGISFNAFFGALYSVYVRGEAYLAAGQPARAAVAFQMIVDHRGIVLADPVDAIARLQLARALAQSGEVAQAQNTYRDFLNLWNTADADIPLLVKARTEYGRLGIMSARLDKTGHAVGSGGK